MSKQSTRQSTKHERRRDRREEQRRLEEERRRRVARNRILLWGGIIVALLAIVGTVLYFSFAPKSTTAQTLPPPEFAQYPNIDNRVACDRQEQTDYHIHAHLTIYINGKNVPLPANIGIADKTCLYWLHVHDNYPGIIHIEAPSDYHDFTFGNFLDVWSQQFAQLDYPSQLNSTTGWTVYVNGKVYNGNFRNILLEAHGLITMAYNSPGVKPDTSYNWGIL
ncbi:MAG: hypothetical protein M3Z24_13205 [Chloroflexota bacterium]|nr:hypothetical protein [Chloroflexota bacterium]